MANALEIYLSQLTPLQKAAIERIHDFQETLKQHGVYVRSAIELEFTIEDANGNPLRGAINLNKAAELLKLASPHVEKFGYEHLSARLVPYNVSQYELNIADIVRHHSDESLNVGSLSPADVAAATAMMKDRTIADVLRQTSSLTAAVPNFKARPYPGYEGQHDTSSALHLNISLYDKEGRNLFAQSARLFDECANTMLAVQKALALALLPNENSVQRIAANQSAPETFMVRYGSKNKSHSSILKRGDVRDDRYRIENRLPGADADPFVAMAVSMAALVKTVSENPRLLHASGLVDEDVRPFAAVGEEAIPTSHAALVERYKSAAGMRELLGAKLYDAILSEYGKETAAAR